MKRFFLLFLILGLFISVPVFADDFTYYDLGLYDSSVDLPPLPDTPDGFPFYMVRRSSSYSSWHVFYFETVDGLTLDQVDFDSSDNNYFCLQGDEGDSITTYSYCVYKLLNGEWNYVMDKTISESSLLDINGANINYTNFAFDCGDHTVVANPILGGVPMILQSHLPRLPQTIMTVGSAVLPKALLILGIILVIGLIPRLIRSWAR